MKYIIISKIKTRNGAVNKIGHCKFTFDDINKDNISFQLINDL
jgi:hypothetical protein